MEDVLWEGEVEFAEGEREGEGEGTKYIPERGLGSENLRKEGI